MPDSLELKKKVNDIEEFLLQNPSPPLGELKNFAHSEGGLVCGKLVFENIEHVVFTVYE